jgi:hypothetical protein
MDRDTEETIIGRAIQGTVLGQVRPDYAAYFAFDETGSVPCHIMNPPELMLAMVRSLD